MTIFNGQKFAQERQKILRAKIKKLSFTPRLVSILVGTDPASLLYTKLKQKAARKVGINFKTKKFPQNSDFKEIIKAIEEYNNDDNVQGIMVQLPLPGNLKPKTKNILRAIASQKDVDGLTNNSPYVPATVKAIVAIVEFATKPLAYFGKKASVIGASGTVGKSIVKKLKEKGFKVTECDQKTRDLYAKLHEADLIVSATGVPNLIKGEMIKEGAILIDVGAPRPDIDPSAAKRASFATPVPGGVGPVTVVSLLENLIEAVYNSS